NARRRSCSRATRRTILNVHRDFRDARGVPITRPVQRSSAKRRTHCGLALRLLPRDQRIDGAAPWFRWTARGSSAVMIASGLSARSVPVNLHAMLLERQAAGRPVTVGLIGAGKFGTMFLSQVRLTDGMHLVAVADLDASRARCQLRTAGWN